jgi:diaminohydroxyphosphoribosylaminopyrimidine deaminase / 5-amino-6-(5-phosphoribosylamino)uracil reductase
MLTEREAMRQALALALRGWGRVAPNPLVGAVLLRDGAVVAEGWHAEFGGPHAEAMALSRCVDPRGTTCVVTLEPCAHTGKTPPCVDALIAAGVRRVVVAVRDPSPGARGGLERLRAAGVAVEDGLLAREAAAQNAPFLWDAARPHLPFVAVKMAHSLDGFIADVDGRSQWISGAEARDWVHWVRAGYDAIGVGRRTALRDDPQLTVRGDLEPRLPPARVIFAGRGEVRSSLRCLDPSVPGRAILVTHPDVAVLRNASVPERVTVLTAATPAEALAALRAEGVRSLLVEGGGTLVGNLLEADLVDRVYAVTAPVWLGQGTPAWGRRRPAPLGAAPRWETVERRALGPDTLVVADRDLCLPAS